MNPFRKSNLNGEIFPSVEFLGRMAKLSLFVLFLVSDKLTEGWKESENQNDYKSEVMNVTLLYVLGTGRMHETEKMLNSIFKWIDISLLCDTE